MAGLWVAIGFIVAGGIVLAHRVFRAMQGDGTERTFRRSLTPCQKAMHEASLGEQARVGILAALIGLAVALVALLRSRTTGSRRQK